MAKEQIATAITKSLKGKKRTRRQKSELQGKFEGLVKLVNEQKLINRIATIKGIDAVKAGQNLRAVVARVGRSEGLVSKRSKDDIEMVFAQMRELRPAVSEFVNDIASCITYRSNKTGKRDKSWIRDLIAGVPRCENGKFFAYCEITEEEAIARCNKMGIELPGEDEEDLEDEIDNDGIEGEDVDGDEDLDVDGDEDNA